MSLSAFAIDINLPLFPAIATSLSAPLSAMPAIVTVFLLFTGIGNLVFGPLSDKYGRKPILVGTMLAFIGGAILSGLAQSLNELLIGRAIQGFSVGSVAVIATAMLRDLFTGRELARSMAIATGIFSVGPIIAPLIGAGIAEVGGGWRIVFYATAIYAALLLGFLLITPETINEKQADATQPSILWQNSKDIILHPQSGYFLVVSGITMISMIVIVATAPAIFNNEFNVRGTQFALLFAIHGTGIIIGQMINHRLIPIYGIVKTSLIAALIMTVSMLFIVVFASVQWLNQYWLSLFITFFAIGFLSVISNALSMVLQPHGDKAGLAASIRSASSMVMAAVATSVLSLFIQGSALIWAIAICMLSFLSAFLLYRWLRSPYATKEY
jgi:DHA1 family bicyclomycin/chloramphenicol resistance-like MFS transporter